MKKKIALLVLVAAVVAAISACSAPASSSSASASGSVSASASASSASASASASSASAASGDLEKIVVTQPVLDAFWGPLYLAQALGYYAEEGLDVEFQTVTNGDPGAPVFAGEAQFGLRGVEMPMTATVQGQGCKIIASTMAKYPYTLMGQSSEYSTIESLKGTTVAGTTPSGSPTAWVKACLAYGGLDVENDVDLTMIAGNGAATALMNGDITATYGANAWIIKQMEEKGCSTILDGRDADVFKEIMGSETYEMHIIFASDDYIAKNPETVQKMANGIVKAFDYINTHTPEEVGEALKPMFPDREDEVMYCVKSIMERDMYNKDGKHTDSGYEAALKMAKMSGLIEKDIPASDIYDESFIEKAWASLK